MKNLKLTVFLLVIHIFAFSQFGTFQEDFNNIDSFSTVSSSLHVINLFDIQSDNKIIAGEGFFRLNENLTLDHTFQNFSSNYKADLIKVLPDDKFYGFGNSSGNKYFINLFNSDGTIHSFVHVSNTQQNIGSRKYINDAVVVDDGIVFVGRFNKVGSFNTFGIGKIDFFGNVITSFNFGGTGFNDEVSKVKTQQDGKYLIVGSFTSYNNLPVNKFARLNTDGSLDTSFSYPSHYNVSNFEILPDGRIIITGNFGYSNSGGFNNLIVLNIDGSVDSTFFNNLPVFNSVIYKLHFDPINSRIFGVGNFSKINNRDVLNVFSLDLNGNFDYDFSMPVSVNPSPIFDDLKTDYNGRIILSAYTTQSNSQQFIFRINPNGIVDKISYLNYGAIGAISRIAKDSDNNLFIAGGFNFYNGLLVNKMVKIFPDGQIDTSFYLKAIGISRINSLLFLNDKILIGGNKLLMLNSDGTVYEEFQHELEIGNGGIRSMAYSNGQLYIGGDFSFTGPTNLTTRNFAILDTLGNFNQYYNNTSMGFNNTVNSIEKLSNNKLVVGGLFTGYNNFLLAEFAL